MDDSWQNGVARGGNHLVKRHETLQEAFCGMGVGGEKTLQQILTAHAVGRMATVFSKVLQCHSLQSIHNGSKPHGGFEDRAVKRGSREGRRRSIGPLLPLEARA